MNLLFSYLGLAGGVLCAIGDILLDLKGKDNQKLGKSGNIDSSWTRMAYWRFGVSIMLAFCGVVLIGFGIYSLADQIKPKNSALAGIIAVLGYVGVVSGLFNHGVLCLQAVIYKKIMESDNFDLADTTLEAYYKAITPPFFVGCLFILVEAVCVAAAVALKYLAVPAWFVVLNPLAFLIIGICLRKLKKEWFYDLPGIVLPSLGLGMYGLIGIVSLL